MPKIKRKLKDKALTPCKKAKSSSSDAEGSENDWWIELGISLQHKNYLPQSECCVFCFSSEDIIDRYGEYLHHRFSGIRVHYFCLFLSSGLSQAENAEECEKNTLCGFQIQDIVKEVVRSSLLRCSFCWKTGASIGCVVSTCKTKFHFPCGIEKEVLSQFFDKFSSYCRYHRPKQVLQTLDNEGDVFIPSKKKKKVKVNICPICLDDVSCTISDNNSITSPCCSDNWMHRMCVQRQATSSGLYFFRCPMCNDSKQFSDEMQRMGIYLPSRDALWELSHNAFDDLLLRHSSCDVENCVCPHGRDYNLKGSKWAVVLCDLCGSSGTHIACFDTVDSENSYFSCSVCVEVHGEDGALELAKSVGIILPPVSPSVGGNLEAASSRIHKKSQKKRKKRAKLEFPKKGRTKK